MACVHLQQLFRICHEQNLKLGGSDLIRVVCHQCGETEVCPSTLMDEYDAREAQHVSESQGKQQDPPASR